MYAIYNILYFIALLAILPYQYFKRPAEIRKRWIRERFGLLPPTVPDKGRPVWIHAVSVGEVIASVPLLKGLKSSYPKLEIVLSTVTDTGQAVARERVGDIARIIYIPFDLPFAVAGAYRSIKPSAFVIMETELWPAIIHSFSRRGVPVLLMNGRLSEKSTRGYLRLRFFIRRVLGDISLFCMQNEDYAQRIISLGAEKDRVRVIGNFKFDTRPSTPAPEWTRNLGRPVIVAGSTHRTEEEIFLDAFERLLPDYPALVLVIAPRHPERFAEVEEIVIKRNLRYLKRSEIGKCKVRNIESEGLRASGAVIILDVMGELASVYGAADIAVMGGSFIARGGQNPLEPAFWGKAVICGPHMENFPFIDEFYHSGAAFETDREGFYKAAKQLLGSPERMCSTGEAARRLYDVNAGAAEKALRIIAQYL